MQSHMIAIGDHGEVIIPIGIRRKLGLEKHDLVLMIVRDDGIVELRPRVRPLDENVRIGACPPERVGRSGS